MEHVTLPCFQVKAAGQVIEQTNKSKDAESAMINATKPVEIFQINPDGSARLLKRIK